ncbi:MAG: putative peptidoglycan glycosyltransferase FtsW [Candidatus Paceibacterota bacterium]
MKLPQATISFLSCILLLLILGFAILAGISTASASIRGTTNPYSVIIKQLVFAIIPGLVIMFTILGMRNLDILKKYALHFVLACYVLMFAVFLPVIGMNAGGASRWINLHFTTVQPSEFFKLALIIYFSYYFSVRRVKKLKDSFIFLGIALAAALPIILQKDLSTLIVTMFSVGVIYLFSEAKLKHIAIIFCCIGVLISFLAFTEAYRFARIKALVTNDSDPSSVGYHQKQLMITVGSGGITGVGLNMSRQKYGGVPQAATDSIFAIIAEETGFFGALCVVGLYVWFIWQGISIAIRSRDTFSKMLSAGITSWIGIQAFIHIFSSIGFLPVTGLPLPFMSAGGTALLLVLTACGVILNISKSQT